jgi:hypothetical protein
MDDEREKKNDDGQQERNVTRIRCLAWGRREQRMPTVKTTTTTQHAITGGLELE